MTVKNECCLTTMSYMKDKEIDLVITSPPYNMNLRIRNGKYCSRQIVKEISTKYDGFDDNLPIDEFYQFHKRVMSEIVRVSKLTFYNFQIVTGSKVAFFKLIGDFADHIKDIIVWDKKAAQPAMRDNVLNSQYEFLLVMGDNPLSRRFSLSNFERGTLSNLWQIMPVKKKNSSHYHGATFPEELAGEIINNFSQEGDLIYDPFAGTGTTGVVAKKLKRQFILSEINKSYCDVIQDRLGSIGMEV